jgi:hypothetical protein
MSRIQFTARDIRNVNSASGTYPSPVHLEAALFETAGPTGERFPSENELEAARFQGRHVAEIARKLSA